jgi:branched-chain amino acid transport system substrate-binding protein
MTGQTSAELADEYEKASGRMWSLPLGFRHSLFEVIFDTLKRAQNIEDKASIRDALKTTNYKSVVGTIDFTKGPFPNTSQTPLVLSQWVKGKQWPIELEIVDNSTAPEIPVTGEAAVIKY